MSVVALRTRSGDRDGVAAVATRVLHGLDELVPRMGVAYRSEIPEYAALTEEEMADEVLATSRRFAEAFLTRIADGADLDELDLDQLRVAGGRRLEMGVPLDSALHAFRIAGREAWNAVVTATKDGEEHVLAELASLWLDYVDRASSTFAEGYLAASHEHLRRLDAQRRAMLDALLDADDPGDAAAVASRYAFSLPRTYVAVLLDGDDVSAQVDAVLAVSPPEALTGTRGHRLLVLVPGDEVEVEPLVGTAGAVRAAWGAPAQPGPGLRTTVRRLETLLDAAATNGHRGTFGPDDLLVEQLLTAAPEVAQRLRDTIHGAIEQEDPDGIFATTLRVYLETGSVPETARRLFVHPNTVAYRLNRIREMTRLDPRIPTDATALVLAVRASGGDR